VTGQRRLAAIGAALLGVGVLPLAIAIAAESLGRALGCSINEASAHACLLAGVDIGEALYTGFVLGWAIIFTAPLFLAGLVVLAIVGIRGLMRLVRR
jgi:hypothetical protein